MSIDIDCVVSVPPAANLIEGASSARELQDAQLRSGQGMIEGSVLSGDQAELIAQLSDRHRRGQLSDADFEKAKRTLLGF